MTKLTIKRSLFLFCTIFTIGGIFITGCSDEDDPIGPGNGGEGEGGGDIVVNVSNGITPDYTWGGGAINDLYVKRVDGADIVWGINGPNGTDPIDSPVTHGTLPTGATKYSLDEDDEIPLEAGITYKVEVTRSNGVFGWREFTPQAEGNDGTGTVSGTVTDAETDLAIADALVSSDDNHTIRTDAGGAYSMTVGAGSRTITVSAAGYAESVKTLDVTADGDHTLDFELGISNGGGAVGTFELRVKDEFGAYVNGTVVTSDDGVTINPPDDDVFTLEVQTGWRLVWASKDGYENGYVWAEVEEGETYPGTIRMTEGETANPMGALKWVIKDSSTMEPIEGAWINHITVDTDFDYSDEDGFFYGVYPENTQHFIIEKSGYANKEVFAEVAANNATDFVVYMMASGGGGSAYVYGRVRDNATNLSIDTGVNITTSDGHSTVTDGNGHYSMTVGTGSVTFTASADNWETQSHTLDLVDGAEWELDFHLTATGGGSGSGRIYGVVTNASTGDTESGVDVTSDDGETTETDDLGEYSLTVDAGLRTITVSKDGFIDNSEQVQVDDGGEYETPIFITTIVEGQLRLILSWGENPEDLDSYLRTPFVIDDETYIVSYLDEGFQNEPPFAMLDNDETDGYGPETITIYQFTAGLYDYWVNDWSENPDYPLAGSGAKVKIYRGNELINTITVPESGEGLYWSVCQIEGSTGQVIVTNQIQAGSPFTVGDRGKKSKH